MRIEEIKYYTMYLNYEEFSLLHEHCNSVGYGYVYDGSEVNFRDDTGHWKLTLTEEMLDEIVDLLEARHSYELYEECNRFAADEIKYLLNDIYYELHYNM